MPSSCRKTLIFLFLTMVLSFHAESLEAETQGQPAKAVRDPHLVHFEIGRDIPPVGFAVDQIKDWQGLITSLRKQLSDLPLGHGTKFLINHVMPAVMNEDEKKVIVGELNKLLQNRELHIRLAGRAAFSAETQGLRTQYRQAPTEENLQWLNRGVISDLIQGAPAVAAETGKKYNKLRGINCLTCHESWKESKPASGVGESDTSDNERLERMIAAQKITPPPAIQVASDKIVPDDEFLRQYEILKKFVVRTDKLQSAALLQAVHAENPYTFKPLLKRLVCVDCHGKDREVDRIEHADGKSHRIKFFYGPIEETLKETHKD